MLSIADSSRTSMPSLLQNQSTCRKSFQAARLNVSCRSHARKESHLARRAAILSGLSLTLFSQGATALGLEGIKPAEKIEGGFQELRRRNQELLDKGAEAFENSDILKALREKSDANKETRLIPGATKSGKQKTPEWLKGVLQKLGQMPPDEAPKTAQ